MPNYIFSSGLVEWATAPHDGREITVQWPHLSEVEKLVPLPEGCCIDPEISCSGVNVERTHL
jgi:hypothetical protein